MKSIRKAMVEAMHEKPFHEAKGESPVHQAGNLLLGQNCIKMDSPWGSNFCDQVDRFNRKSGLVDKVVRGLSWRPFSFFLYAYSFIFMLSGESNGLPLEVSTRPC